MGDTFKNKFNKKHNQPKDKSNSLADISRLSGIKLSAIQKIYNKGVGAFKTAGPSRPNMTKESWAFGRVYASISPGSKSSKIDAKELAEGKSSTNSKPLNKPFRSKVKGKKYSVYVKDGDKIKLISFGAKGMDDWRGTDGNQATKEQRKSFRARIKGIKRKDGSFAYLDKTSPAYWSLNFLW